MAEVSESEEGFPSADLLLLGKCDHLVVWADWGVSARTRKRRAT